MPQATETEARLYVLMPANASKHLEAEAEATGETKTEITRRAIGAFLDKLETTQADDLKALCRINMSGGTYIRYGMRIPAEEAARFDAAVARVSALFPGRQAAADIVELAMAEYFGEGAQ